METIKRYYRVDPTEIAYISTIVHLYEGLAVFRTIDPQSGIIQMLISPFFLKDVEALIEALKSEVRIFPVEEADLKSLIDLK